MAGQKIVLLVGAVGVGKTSVIKSIREDGWVCRDLDGLAAEWAVRLCLIETASVQLLRDTVKNDELFLAVGLQAIGDLAGRDADKHLLIDVGAGFHDANYAKYLHRVFPTITLVCDRVVAYGRLISVRGDERDLAGYTQAEFNEHRRKVYDRSRYKFDTTRLTLAETVERVTATLRDILA